MLPLQEVDLTRVGRSAAGAVAEQHGRAVELRGLGGGVEHQRQPAGGELHRGPGGVEADSVGEQVEAEMIKRVGCLGPQLLDNQRR